MTQLWQVDPQQPDPTALAAAAALLRDGQLVAIPTETVYGLAADGLNETAVRKIFDVKGRPAGNPLIMHVAERDDAKALASEWPTFAEKLTEKFWPGPLTVVVNKADHVPDNVTAGGPTVAIRCPAHAVARELIRQCGRPLAAPSANRSTELSPTRAIHVQNSLGGAIAGIVDAGPCAVGIESTVVDCTGRRPVLLRPGSLSREELQAVVGPVMELDAADAKETVKFRSPGQMTRHYSPKTPIVLVDTTQMALDKCLADQSKGIRSRSVGLNDGLSMADDTLPDTPEGYASRLYDFLHEIDARGDVDRLIIEMPPPKPEWQAIRDRLFKAAGVTPPVFEPAAVRKQKREQRRGYR